MKGAGRALLEMATLLLEPQERDVVLGDLTESGETDWRGLANVLGLVVRRQATLWKDWRPWFTAFAVSLLSSLFLMGFSLSVSLAYQRCVTPRFFVSGQIASPVFWIMICQVFLLIGWSWSSGFVVGSVSRRTLWASVASACIPCLFCLVRFRVENLSRFCLLLFLLPGIWGVRRGLRMTGLSMIWALIIAMAVTISIVPVWIGSGQSGWNLRVWIINLTLSAPAWYLVAAARESKKEENLAR